MRSALNQNNYWKIFLYEMLLGTSSSPCDPNPCLNSGSCSVVGSTFECTCTASWTGTTCDVPVLSCQPNPCQNGGTCSIIANSVSCDCPLGWGGPNCESKYAWSPSKKGPNVILLLVRHLTIRSNLWIKAGSSSH